MIHLDEVVVKCVVCGEVVPDDRKRRRAITCCNEHATERNKYLRARTDARKCRFCGQPCTDTERESYKAWRRWQRELLREQAKTVVK